jgi:hypothetical protein
LTNKKRNPHLSVRRTIRRLERQLKGVEAQIARLEKNKTLNLAKQDHFLLWKRPNLFAPPPSELQH